MKKKNLVLLTIATVLVLSLLVAVPAAKAQMCWRIMGSSLELKICSVVREQEPYPAPLPTVELPTYPEPEPGITPTPVWQCPYRWGCPEK